MRSDTVKKNVLLELGFRDKVINEFKFLEDEYGFNRKSTEISFVIYESKNVSFIIYHGRTTYTMGIEVKLSCNSSINGAIFTLREIFELFNIQEIYNESQYYTQKSDKVKELVKILANVIRTYGRDMLLGNIEVYEKMYKIRDDFYKKHNEKYDLKNRREFAEHYWKVKNYHKYISLMEPIEDKLSALEIKKLEYSRKLCEINVKHCIK